MWLNILAIFGLIISMTKGSADISITLLGIYFPQLSQILIYMFVTFFYQRKKSYEFCTC